MILAVYSFRRKAPVLTEYSVHQPVGQQRCSQRRVCFFRWIYLERKLWTCLPMELRFLDYANGTLAIVKTWRWTQNDASPKTSSIRF